MSTGACVQKDVLEEKGIPFSQGVYVPQAVSVSKCVCIASGYVYVTECLCVTGCLCLIRCLCGIGCRSVFRESFCLKGVSVAQGLCVFSGCFCIFRVFLCLEGMLVSLEMSTSQGVSVPHVYIHTPCTPPIHICAFTHRTHLQYTYVYPHACVAGDVYVAGSLCAACVYSHTLHTPNTHMYIHTP